MTYPILLYVTQWMTQIVIVLLNMHDLLSIIHLWYIIQLKTDMCDMHVIFIIIGLKTIVNA